LHVEPKLGLLLAHVNLKLSDFNLPF
jgi:hypothetical protein